MPKVKPSVKIVRIVEITPINLALCHLTFANDNDS
jgi:hypothetical protein